MDFIKDCFSRIDLQQIRCFISTGGDVEPDKSTYEERLEKGKRPLVNLVKSFYANVEEYDEVAGNIVNGAMGIYEEVFFEIGIKIGARLAYQLFCENER